MRIVGGAYRGRKITAPKGDVSRPTTDKNREALFNILSHRDGFDFEACRVIDLFAGSGALGLEALSRGAGFVLFVETDARARGAIRDNIDALHLFGVTRLHRRSATSLGPRPSNMVGAYDLAFLDPPYHKQLVAPSMAGLAKGGWLTPDALVVVEQAKDEEIPQVDGFALEDRREWGDSAVSFFRYSG